MQTIITTTSLILTPFLIFILIITLHNTETPPQPTKHSNRRTLHSQGPQPLFNFFPSSPYSLPPSQPPKPSLPKFPSSSSSSTSPPLSTLSFQPFFPFYPSPPPPQTPSTTTTPTTLPTFPANFSSSSRHKSPSKLLISIAIPLLSVTVLSLIFLLFLILRRGNRRSKELFPPENAPKNSSVAVAGVSSGAGVAASEFLYLGTLASSHAAPAPEMPAAESPELRPLPPLPRQHRGVGRREDDDDEDYYSPKDSPTGSKVDRSQSRSSTTSSRSEHSSTSPTKVPTQLIRPPTPSPPKRRPASHSQSPPEVDMGISRGNGKGIWAVPQRIGEFASSRGSTLPPEFNAGISREACEGNRGVPQRIGEFASTRGPPLPPPPPPMGGLRPKGVSLMPPALSPPKPPARNLNGLERSEGNGESVRPKLKPLHWDKVRASSDRAMVWDQLKSGSFQLDEEMIETLFGREAARLLPKESVGSGALNQENEVLDPRKAQNIAIMLRALNVDKEEVCEALREGSAARLGNELLEALTRMIPSKEEELKLKEWRDDLPFKLGLAESFLKAVLDIPFAFKRVDAMLYIVNFDSEVDHLRNLFETLEVACEELRNNRIFHKILGAVLKTGNRMNVGTNRGDARAFKLDTLLKLVDIKGTDGKTTLLHFVIQEIIRAEGSRLHLPETARPNAHADHEYRKLGLQIVSALGTELSNVKKAAAMDSDVLTVCVLKLAGGISKVREVVRLNNMNNTLIDRTSQKFHDAMIGFLIKAERTILEIQNQESNALSLVKETTQYFHGDSAKEEAHPFRIFVVVRDFLVILDHVCKEVEKTNESTLPNMSHWLPASMNQTSFSALPGFNASKLVTSDDENSLSS